MIMVSKRLPSQFEEKLNSMVKDRRESLLRDIKVWRDCIERDVSRLASIDDDTYMEVEKWAEVVQKLDDAGIPYLCYDWSLNITIEVDKKLLPNVYNAIGRLDGSKTQKTVENYEEGIILVTVPSAHYPNVKVCFKHKLSPSDRCQIKEIKYKTLVCE